MNHSIRIEHLADHPETLPILRGWFETEWESYYGPDGPGDAEADLIAYSGARVGARRTLPLPVGLVAFLNDEVCGIAALKADSISAYPHLLPWAAAGLVAPEYRRRGIGAMLLNALEVAARDLGYPFIYCGTATASALLERCGWQFMECISYCGDDVSIYRKGL